MYFVDRSKIQQTLTHINELLTEIKGKQINTLFEKLGFERCVHVIIESVLDVGNMLIDGFIMRDSGSYHVIIDIMIDEKVLPAEVEMLYKNVINLREFLVHNYLEIDHEQLEDTLKENIEVLQKFSAHIEAYLNNELGVANAFSNED